MKQNILIIAGLLAVGVVIGASLNASRTPAPATPQATDKQPTSMAPSPVNPFSEAAPRQLNKPGGVGESYQQLSATVASLESRLNQEIDKRRGLEQKIALLEKSIRPAAAGNQGAENESVRPIAKTQNSQRDDTPSSNTNWFNEKALLDSGIDPARVNYIKDAFEQAEMEKLYLRDQATREGWMGTKRYQEAAKDIADRSRSLRAELTDPEYDAYLYATGRANRVIVESVLGGSPASNAGIQAGDAILRYDNKPVYNWSDLTSATSEGDPNATVAVTIERNDQQQQVYVPRGPLGIRLSTDSVAP